MYHPIFNLRYLVNSTHIIMMIEAVLMAEKAFSPAMFLTLSANRLSGLGDTGVKLGKKDVQNKRRR